MPWGGMGRPCRRAQPPAPRMSRGAAQATKMEAHASKKREMAVMMPPTPSKKARIVDWFEGWSAGWSAGWAEGWSEGWVEGWAEGWIGKSRPVMVSFAGADIEDELVI